MAFVLVVCVPCALVSIVLTPPILLSDYWLICPTCLPSLPSSFAPFIISLCLQSCASLSLYQPWLHRMFPILAKPCQLSCFPLRGSFFLFVLFLMIKKLIICSTESSPHPFTPKPDRTNWPKDVSAEMGIFLFPSPTTGLYNCQVMVQHVNARYIRQQGADMRDSACEFLIGNRQSGLQGGFQHLPRSASQPVGDGEAGESWFLGLRVLQLPLWGA